MMSTNRTNAAPRPRAEFTRVCAMLGDLTEAELAELRVRAGFLSGGTTAPREDDDWLLRGIEEELRRLGIVGSGHLDVVRIAPKWPKASARARADLMRHLPKKTAKRWTGALGRLVARALADWLRGAGVPVGPKTMLTNADKVLLALDAQFPGYLAAGLLPCCLDPALVGRD